MIVWVMLYISLLCYPKIVAPIEICGLHTKRWNEQPHPKRYVKRETHISVLPAKSWPVQSGSNPGHPICKHRWLGVPWITVRSRSRELWAQQVAIHSNIFSHDLTCHSLKCDSIMVCVCLFFWISCRHSPKPQEFPTHTRYVHIQHGEA